MERGGGGCSYVRCEGLCVRKEGDSVEGSKCFEETQKVLRRLLLGRWGGRIKRKNALSHS